MNNKFIVFEGLSGAGKTTIGKMVAERLGATEYKTPAPLFNTIREAVDHQATIQARFLFYMAGIIQASHDIVQLLELSPVVCDRYILTTVCWHKTMDVETDGVEAFATPHIRMPDFTFLITARDDVRRKRLTARGMTINDRMEAEQDIETCFMSHYKDRKPIEIDNSSDDRELAVAEILRIVKSE